ncbi:MAG: SocA family protein [Treponema sp.]|jgi:hypothetical protein|nr:SocA family protein [Treponema sp.]
MINRQVFKDTLFSIIELAGDTGIGAVKLNKCLIIIDALHKALYGETLTGAIYIKHKFGTVPGREAYNLMQEIIVSGDIEIFDEMVSPGIYEKNHYLRTDLKAPVDSFNDEELELISWTVSTVMSMTAQQISEISHNKCYHDTPMFQEINLDNIFTWKILDDQADDNSFERGISEIDFNELNNIVQGKQAAFNSAF